MNWIAEDLFRLEIYSDAQYLGEGRDFLFTENDIDQEHNNYRSRLMKWHAKDAKREVLVEGESIIKSPEPDAEGKSVLFVMEAEGKNQVHRLDLQTKSIELLTNTQNGVSKVLWQPNGEEFFYTTILSAQPQYEEVYVTEELDYFADGRGLLQLPERTVIFRQNLATGEGEELTELVLGYQMRSAISISPCGQWLAYADKNSLPGRDDKDTCIYLLNLQTLEKKAILQEQILQGGEPSFSPDGRYLAFVGNKTGYHTSLLAYLIVYDLKEGKLCQSTLDEDRQWLDFMVSDTQWNQSSSLVKWSADSKWVYGTVSEKGRVYLRRISPEGREPSEIVYLEDEHMTGFDLNGEGRLLLTLSSPHKLTQILELDPQHPQETFSMEPDLEWPLPNYEEISYRSSDQRQMHALLALPGDRKEGESIPLILNLHGGPYMMHGYTFHHEIQIMLSRGYGVLLLNPRGSIGYGEAHQKAILGEYGGMDYQDVITGLDHVLEKYPQIDKEHLYVTGGSYGGFMTNWILTQTDRFRAAATQRSISNMVSMWGTSDIGYYFYKDESRADILSWEKLWKTSPLAYVERVKTPTLVLHAEEDWRCPLEQGMQWFTALKYLGVDSRFVRFPHSSHGLSRSGNPAYRVIRINEILSWFERYR